MYPLINTPVVAYSVNAMFDPENEPDYGVQDKIKVVNRETGVVSDIKIEEETREYSKDGLSVNLRLGRPRARLVSATVEGVSQVAREMPVPRLTARGITRGIKVNARFDDFPGWSETRYYVGIEEGFELSGEFLLKRDRSREVELSGLLPGRVYYVKAVNMDNLGNFSEESEEVRVRTSSEATGATVFVAASNTNVRGRAGGRFRV